MRSGKNVINHMSQHQLAIAHKAVFAPVPRPSADCYVNLLRNASHAARLLRLSARRALDFRRLKNEFAEMI